MATGDFGPNGPGYGPGGSVGPASGQPGGYPLPVRGQRPGGLGRRCVARLIDGALVYLVAGVLSLFVFDDNYPFLWTGLFSGVLTFGYFILFEVTRGATPGKGLLGLTVRGPDGLAKPTVRQSAIRNAFTLLTTLVPYLGGLVGFVAYVVIAATISASPTKQGKHDELAGGTRVIRD